MIKAWWTRGLWFVVAVAALLSLPVACGSGNASGGTHGTSGSGRPGGQGVGGNCGGTGNLPSITVIPPMATIESLNGMPVTQSFTATGHFKDGTTGDISSMVTWTAPGLQIGSIGPNGLYTASG